MKDLRAIFIITTCMLTACQTNTTQHEKKQINQDKQIPTETLFILKTPAETGVHFTNQIQETFERNILTYQYLHNGTGVAIGDVNNDGLQDFYLTGNMQPNALYINKGSFQFENIAKTSGTGGKKGWTTGTTMADVNADGWLDIYVCRSGKVPPQTRRNLLYINNKNGTFSEQAAQFGLADPGYSIQATFFDYDNDGDLDCLVLNHPLIALEKDKQQEKSVYANNHLYRNENGIFEEVSQEAGLENNSMGFSIGVATSDFNNDSFIDIYISNDYSEHDYLYLNNQDGTFRQVIHDNMAHISNFSMGSDVADVNNDGYMDLFVADMAAEDNYRSKANMAGMNPEKFFKLIEEEKHYQYMINTLQLNRGNALFSEISQLAGIDKTDWSWAPLFADFDLDGFQDLFVSNGQYKEERNKDFVNFKKKKLKYLEKHPNEVQTGLKEILDKIPQQKIKNYIYQNNGDLTFTKKTTEWGLDIPSISNSSAYADLDQDGDLDLIICNMDAPPFIYQNNAEKLQHHALAVRLAGPEKNKFGIGAKVTLHTKKGKQTKEMFSTRGYQGAVAPIVYFGVKHVGDIINLEVEWNDKQISSVVPNKDQHTISVSYQTAQEKNQVTNLASSTFQRSKTQLPSSNFLDPLYDDFAKEVLIPHRMSELGPAVAVADVNADGLDDIFIGGAKGKPGKLYVQQAGLKWNVSTIQAGAKSEDTYAIFFDANGDNHPDLYVGSGSNEWPKGDQAYQDRLFLNNGKGKFTLSQSLPSFTISTGCVLPFDFDQDGDLDLFVGSRQTPGEYPLAESSVLLINNQGKFEDRTDELAPALATLGMIQTAKLISGKEQAASIVVGGEWTAPTLLQVEAGKLIKVEKAFPENQYGWWQTFYAYDFDEDGDVDILAGNLGLNYKYKASVDEPFEVYAKDFDENGKLDIVLSYYQDGISFPVRGKQCSSEQIESISEKFTTYHDFASANLIDIYTKPKLDDAYKLSAQNFFHTYFENKGNNSFTAHILPNETQLSAIKSFEKTTHGILAVGNHYQSEVETPRNDAGLGTLLVFEKGNWTTKPLNESHALFKGDTRILKTINTNQQQLLLVGKHNDKALLITQ